MNWREAGFSMLTQDRYAIVAPYHTEADFLLRRCMESVKKQTMSCDHILVSDGHPKDWIDQERVRHLKLDRSHNDYGNTPRGLGALLAIAEGYSGIGFLDADNWLEPSHIDECLKTAQKCPGGNENCDFVIAKRFMRRLDETVLPHVESPYHVDTNCFFFLKGAFSIVPHWALMPREVSALGDRVFFALLRKRNYRFETITEPTVNYHCFFEAHYKVLGEKAPAGAKPSIDRGPIMEWINGLSARDTEIAKRLSGIDFDDEETRTILKLPKAILDPPEKIRRNSVCPCGSGLRYKNCHGSLSAGL